jgi:hypothetical protein
MAKALKAADMYQQILVMTLTEAAANGGIITAIPTSQTIRDKVGIEIYAYEFHMSGAFGTEYAAVGDGVSFGLTQIQNGGIPPTTIASTPGIICFESDYRHEMGVAATATLIHRPYRVRFETPFLAHPAALFAFHQGVSQAAALTARHKIWYKYVDIADDMYQEIIQTIVLQNSI